MNRWKSFSLLFCLAVLLALAAIVSQRVSADDREGNKIVFVDVKLVIDGYLKTQILEEQIDKDRTAGQEAVAKKREKIEEMRKDLDLFRPGSPGHHKLTADIIKEQALLKCEEDILQRDIQFSLLKATREIYQEVREYCIEMRKREGYAAILKLDSAGIESESKAELILKINCRSVLACDPSMDMTEKVIAGLNKKFKK